jgi:hypothetical protein
MAASSEARKEAEDSAHLRNVVGSFALYSAFANAEADRRQKHLARIDAEAKRLL